MTIPTRRAHLNEIFGLALAAEDVDGLRQALLQLTLWVQGEEAARTERAQLLRLVRDAARLLSDQSALGWGSDVSDWLYEAEAFVKRSADV